MTELPCSDFKRNIEMKPGEQMPPGFSRLALSVEYVGSAYAGWQKQKGHVEQTIQNTLEQALSFVADEPIAVVCAGRTDAGVHATNQTVHFDTLALRPLQAWTQGVNAQLPKDIRVHWAGQVSPQFHARFSALSRRYRYIILNTPSVSALAPKTLTWVRRKIDMGVMQEAANSLQGKHDFSSFRSVHCQAHTAIRTLDKISINRVGDLVVVDILGNAFLHHMVRNIMGVILPIALGDKPLGWEKEVLAAKDRSCAGLTEKPHGLYLVGVDYPTEFNIPKFKPGPLFLSGFSG